MRGLRQTPNPPAVPRARPIPRTAKTNVQTLQPADLDLARRMAEDSCSAREIGAATGHRTLKEVAHHTDRADQAALAVAAMKRLQVKTRTVAVKSTA